MTARTRLFLFLVSAAVIAAFFTGACLRLPRFRSARHPYGDRAVAAAIARHTANVDSSVNFDIRAFDTLGEESILFGTVLGATLQCATCIRDASATIWPGSPSASRCCAPRSPPSPEPGPPRTRDGAAS
ncbi:MULTISPECIES: hypothetical protein [unclassified Streptomyces]|uniref:hypothetical protein n=1 Tax=unclassified Streptomyces TaxID=2593676 RepID=UPI0036F0EB54